MAERKLFRRKRFGRQRPIEKYRERIREAIRRIEEREKRVPPPPPPEWWEVEEWEEPDVEFDFST